MYRKLLLACFLLLVGLLFCSPNAFAIEKYMQGPEVADVKWTACKGETLTIGLNKHPFTESLRPLLPEFESITGIRVAYIILPEQEYFEKLLIDLSSGAGVFDVYMTSPMFEWRYQYAGWIEDLWPYFENTELTDKEWYNRDDFITTVMNGNN